MQKPVSAQLRRGGKRRDDQGRAFAGSQLQMQLYVARRQGELTSAVLNALRLARATFDRIDWVAPLEHKRFSEPCDGTFLELLGLRHLRAQLADFWPKGGPRWDALAVLQPGAGVLLVEAKSYPGEIRGGGCKAVPESRTVIERSIRTARDWFGASKGADWLGPLYQYANRLAHVRFLREVAGRTAWLANVCFLDDPIKPTTRMQWDVLLPDLKSALGFRSGTIPYVIDVFLPARDRRELVAKPREPD